MKRRLVLVLLLLLSFTLLTACGSDKKMDNKVKDYVHEKYGFNIDITERDSVNEGNMGDLSYIVTKSEKPKVQFTVNLSGMIFSTVTKDDYFLQEKAYRYSQQFIKKNDQKLKSFGYDHIDFASSNVQGLDVSVDTNQTISLNDQSSIDQLLEFIQLLNQYKEANLYEVNFDRLTISNNQDDSIIHLNKINKIHDLNSLNKQLKS